MSELGLQPRERSREGSRHQAAVAATAATGLPGEAPVRVAVVCCGTALLMNAAAAAAAAAADCGGGGGGGVWYQLWLW